MSTHNIGFYEDLTKIIFESNMHLISSAELTAKKDSRICLLSFGGLQEA